MTGIRKALFWLHLIAGSIAGLVILTMSLTGVLLTYERQILASLGRPGEIRPAAGAARLKPGELLARIAASEQIGRAHV